MISVIVADDHAVVRTGLQLVFQNCSVISISAEASSGNELLDTLKRETFDVAIVDVNMPGLSSLNLINEIRKHYPDLPIVIFTMNTDMQLATRMFKNGVKAYINKEENPEELIEAVKCVYLQERYLTNQQEYFYANQFIVGSDQSLNHECLTDREYQVMCLLASGQSKTEIADKLAISKNTISNHRNNILKRLSLSNNVELTKYALSHHMVQ
ncbi:MAG: response regulator transcription factor [Carboxylicivirga sp.]|jgi:DNA-binding NarL/FixJ family response regulator|nr:response regulator transcription factor [Carboxylicivirga sp.]